MGRIMAASAAQEQSSTRRIERIVFLETRRWAKELLEKDPQKAIPLLALIWAYLHPAARYADEIQYQDYTVTPGSPLAEAIEEELRRLIAGRIAKRLLDRLPGKTRNTIDACTAISIEELVLYTTSNAIDPAEAEICGTKIADIARKAICRTIAEAVKGPKAKCREALAKHRPTNNHCDGRIVAKVYITLTGTGVLLTIIEEPY